MSVYNLLLRGEWQNEGNLDLSDEVAWMRGMKVYAARANRTDHT